MVSLYFADVDSVDFIVVTHKVYELLLYGIHSRHARTVLELLLFMDLRYVCS